MPFGFLEILGKLALIVIEMSIKGIQNEAAKTEAFKSLSELARTMNIEKNGDRFKIEEQLKEAAKDWENETEGSTQANKNTLSNS